MLYNFIIENYLFIILDPVQGFHWENSQLSVHPFVVYYRNKNGSQSLCSFSDNQSAVHSFLVVALSFVKSKLFFLCKMLFTSVMVQPASLYKNYKAFNNLRFHE